ncbi:MAG: holo-ACP synthase [Anaerolineales bacterium]|nr:holo-ACP synthase [Anaerolineales bacterium]
MKLTTGVDQIEINRVQIAVMRHGRRFLERVYTRAELDICKGKIASLAVRFAGKEAVAKALGCGIGDVAWKEIEILNNERRAPQLNLHGAAAQKARLLGLRIWSISLSHDQSTAIAFVVALGK